MTGESKFRGLTPPRTGRMVVGDTETTGFGAEKERIVEVGLIEVIDMRITGRRYHTYVNPEHRVHAEAQKVHGLSRERLASEPVFASIADEMVAFIGDDPFIAHNVEFDSGFIQAELKRAGRKPLTCRWVDTVTLFRALLSVSKLSLDDLCKRFRVSLEDRRLHGALIDAHLLAQCYISGLGAAAMFDLDTPAPATLPNNAVFHPARLMGHAAASEQLAHAAFVAKDLTKPLWQLGEAA